MKKFIFVLILISSISFLFAEKPLVQDIKAVTGNGNKINVVWNLPSKPEKELTKLLVYRDTTPISSYAQLSELTPVAELVPILTSYTDSVYDFKDYFYAVIAVTDKPYDMVLVSINSTVNGVHLNPQKKEDQSAVSMTETKEYDNGRLREIPLPYLDYIEGMDGKTVISDETAKAAQELGSKKQKKLQKLPVYVFEQDMVSPEGGDDFLLFDVLKNTFIKKKYSEAIAQLEKLAGTNISSDTRNRSYFYMAESQYMSGQYKDCIRTLVRLENVYPELTKQWIDSSLDQLSK